VKQDRNVADHPSTEEEITEVEEMAEAKVRIAVISIKTPLVKQAQIATRKSK